MKREDKNKACGYQNNFILNEEMYVEDGEAWFVNYFENSLFRWNLQTEECSYITMLPVKTVNEMPEGLKKYRANSSCIKCGSFVFCLPLTGKSILVYNIDEDKIEEILINNQDNVELNIWDGWKQGKTLWAVSMGLN